MVNVPPHYPLIHIEGLGSWEETGEDGVVLIRYEKVQWVFPSLAARTGNCVKRRDGMSRERWDESGELGRNLQETDKHV